jgi:hypothetical protein
MQVVAVILLIISLGTTVGPVGAVVVMYRDNLPGLVIPPQVQELMNGNNSSIVQTIFYNGDSGFNGGTDDTGNGTDELSPMGFVMPTFVSASVDAATKTFSVTVNVTDFLRYDLTLYTINATVENTQTCQELATIHLLDSPITIPAGQYAFVTVAGEWTQAAEDYLAANPNATSIPVTLTNAVINVSGFTVATGQPINIGNIPLTLG